MSHYLGLCVSFKGKNDFSNLVSVQQLGTLVGRRRIATNLGISIKYHADACGENTPQWSSGTQVGCSIILKSRDKLIDFPIPS